MTKKIKDPARKRRLPRLSSALLLDEMMPGPDDMMLGPDGIPMQKWEPTAAHWEAMAKIADCQFDTADQAAITNLVASYVQFQPFEPSAPFVRDVKKHLDKLDKAADQFYQALQSGEALEDEIERNAAFHAETLISGHLKEKHCALAGIDDFKSAMFEFLIAVPVARCALNAGGGLAEGESWGRLVIGLARWFESKGLRVSASKGGKPSPFVAFARELQLTFPERFRRHDQSHEALAKKISAALKNARDLKSKE